MDVFNLRQTVIHDYAEYVRSFVKIRNPDLKSFVDQGLSDQALWPQPLIQMNPSFAAGGSGSRGHDKDIPGVATGIHRAPSCEARTIRADTVPRSRVPSGIFTRGSLRTENRPEANRNIFGDSQEEIRTEF